MNKKILNQQGIAHLALIIALLVVSVTGFTYYRIVASNKNDKTVSNLANHADEYDYQEQNSELSGNPDELSTKQKSINKDPDKNVAEVKKDTKPGGATTKQPKDKSSQLLPDTPPKKTDSGRMEHLYGKIQNGFTYKKVRDIVGEHPEGNCQPGSDCFWSGNCMDKQDFPNGDMTCYWSDKTHIISVEFESGAVTSKSIAKK